ncbi:MAG: SHOCT domain-containing protein, partial [Pseudonocardia sp.]
PEPAYAPPPQYAAPPAPPAAGGAAGMDARIEQLTQLAALRDQGVLSAAEFEAQKAQILAG